ncbi:MAG TPA: hypothetical protein IAB32_02220 [Candidatus Scatosoma pullicola]|nr:hypothetical protein [Candidatus Scatosoma pullicola]
MVVLAIIGVIVGIVLLYFLIKLLFSTYILATVLSVGLSIASLVIAGKIIDVGVDSSRADSLQIATLICTTLAWSFFMGPIMFETSDELWITLRHWDEIKEFWTDIEFSWRETGGFLSNLAISAIAIAIVYFLFGSQFTALYYILPACILIANAVGAVRLFLGRRF